MATTKRDLKILYVDDTHHWLARAVASMMGITIREAVERLVRGDSEAATVAREMAARRQI